MKYANPTPPEGISTGGYRPLREFFILAGALLLAVGVALVVVFQFTQWVAPWVPFSWERQVSAPFVRAFVGKKGAPGATQAELQRLADRLVPLMDLPDGMTIQVHYVESATVNALATVGGNLVVFQGLLARLPSEEALAMVMAHEIAHVKNRDVLAAMGGGVIVSIASQVLLGDVGLVRELVDFETLMTMLRYSRAKEARADLDAFKAVVQLYGHGGGARDLFDLFQKIERENGVARKSDLMRSHPLTATRLDGQAELARERGWPMDGERTPLSGSLRVEVPAEEEK